MGQTTQIKNWAVWLLGGLLALFVAGCGSASGGSAGGGIAGGGPPTPEAPPEASSPPPPPPPLDPGANLELISTTPGGTVGNHVSETWGYTLLSADGRFSAFASMADNLVPGDTNGSWDIFVRDRQTGETTRVSVDSGGNEVDHVHSHFPSLSADGRFVAFMSDADNVVPGDTNALSDIFVHDRETGETTRVSVDSDGKQSFLSPGGGYGNDGTAISANGRFVTFWSDASNLVPGDTNWNFDIFVHDRLTGETTRVSVSSDGEEANGGSMFPIISADGRFVAFESSASNLVPDGGHGAYVHDRLTGETTLISVDASGNRAIGRFFVPMAISADGRVIAIGSNPDVFVHDRLTGETTLVSVDSAGNRGTGGDSGPSSISADGRFVGFYSKATNLVPGDTNDDWDAFVHDRLTGETTRVSVNAFGEQGNRRSLWPIISADGCTVMFYSEATNMVSGDNNGRADVFIADFTSPLACEPPVGDPPPIADVPPICDLPPKDDDDDMDDDGLTDHQELTETFTHYFEADSDEDGVDDCDEVNNGTDPLDPADPADPADPGAPGIPADPADPADPAPADTG